MEALQGVELTGTNRSEVLTNYANALVTLEVLLCTALQVSRRDRLELRLAIAAGIKVSGAHGGGVPPVPIPNTAVKPASADDSRAAGPLESRTVPDFSKIEARRQATGLYLF